MPVRVLLLLAESADLSCYFLFVLVEETLLKVEIRKFAQILETSSPKMKASVSI